MKACPSIPAKTRGPLFSMSLAFVALAGAACAGSPAPSAADPTKPATTAAGASAPAASPAQPAERPFAASAAQATELIGDVLDKRSGPMNKCISEYRTRKNLPNERVEISVGIDQNGILIGATLKKTAKQPTPDPALDKCMQEALASALFPKSHAGIITMTKSYENIVQ